MFKGLRLAKPLKRVSRNVFDEVVDPLNDFRIILLPVQIIFPGFFGP